MNNHIQTAEALFEYAQTDPDSVLDDLCVGAQNYVTQVNDTRNLTLKLTQAFGLDRKLSAEILQSAEIITKFIWMDVSNTMERIINDDPDLDADDLGRLVDGIHNYMDKTCEGEDSKKIRLYRSPSLLLCCPSMQDITSLRISQSIAQDLIEEHGEKRVVSQLNKYIPKPETDMILDFRFGPSGDTAIEYLSKVHDLDEEQLLSVIETLPLNLHQKRDLKRCLPLRHLLDQKIFKDGIPKTDISDKEKTVIAWYLNGATEAFACGIPPLYVIAFGVIIVGFPVEFLVATFRSTRTISDLDHSLPDEPFSSKTFKALKFIVRMLLPIPLPSSSFDENVLSTAIDRIKSNLAYHCLYLRSHSKDYEGNEAALTQGIQRLFNVIAFSSPTETSQPSGAGRFKKGDGHWQNSVFPLIQNSLYVLIKYDSTEGILWETKTTLNTKIHHFIIIYFDNLNDSFVPNTLYKDFLNRFSDSVGSDLPEQLMGSGYLIFPRDNVPTLKPIKFSIFEPAWRSYLTPLMEVFSELEQQIEYPRTLMKEVTETHDRCLLGENYRGFPLF